MNGSLGDRPPHGRVYGASTTSTYESEVHTDLQDDMTATMPEQDDMTPILPKTVHMKKSFAPVIEKTRLGRRGAVAVLALVAFAILALVTVKWANRVGENTSTTVKRSSQTPTKYVSQSRPQSISQLKSDSQPHVQPYSKLGTHLRS
jgi:hypothetical protein